MSLDLRKRSVDVYHEEGGYTAFSTQFVKSLTEVLSLVYTTPTEDWHADVLRVGGANFS